MRFARSFLLMGFAGVCLGLVSPGTAHAADEPPAVSVNAAAEAKALRDKGLAFFKKKAYAQAVEVFQKAIALERKAGVMANMASALNELGRYDEALRWYETVLREFPTASEALRGKVKKELADLAAKVGTIAVEGDEIRDARLFIDSRSVGDWPLEAPVHVLAGVHEVRAEKPGFTPIRVSVDVTAGKPSVAKLVATEREAKIDIREKHNWRMRIEIDGKDEGLSPLVKKVKAGEHRIRLRGFMRPEALLACETPAQEVDMGARMESEEKVVTLGLFETQIVELSAEDMDGSLHLESQPKGATLFIDGHETGQTPWDGRLPLGEHDVEVMAKGFFPTKQKVLLERRKPRDLAVVLEREPNRAAEERAAKNAKIGVGIAYGIGGLGLGMFAVAGGLALKYRSELRETCLDGHCPSTEDIRLKQLRTLGSISTIGVVITGLGAAAGTTIFFLTRPGENKHSGASGVGLSVGLGGLAIDGRF